MPRSTGKDRPERALADLEDQGGAPHARRSPGRGCPSVSPVHPAPGPPPAGTRRRRSSWCQPDVSLHSAPLLLGVHGRGCVRLGGHLCVLFPVNGRTQVTHGDAQVVPGDGSLSAPVHGPPRTAYRDQGRERLPPDHRRPVLEASTAVPLAGITATDVSSAFCRDCISVYGPPDTVRTDNGHQFASLFFQGVWNLMGIQNLYMTTYHPQTNGHVESFNETLVDMFMHCIEDHQVN